VKHLITNVSVGARAVEVETKSFILWSWSLKFEFQFHRASLWGKQQVQIIQCFSIFNGPNHSGDKNSRCLELVPEI